MTMAAIFGHRGITHSLIAVAVMSFAAWYSLHGLDWHPGYSVPFTLGLSAGYLSHLAGDWMTNTGVPLLWPNRKRVAAPVTIQTGSPIEYLIALGLYAWLGTGIINRPQFLLLMFLPIVGAHAKRCTSVRFSPSFS